mgnify:CR=1 FL=1
MYIMYMPYAPTFTSMLSLSPRLCLKFICMREAYITASWSLLTVLTMVVGLSHLMCQNFQVFDLLLSLLMILYGYGTSY